MDPAAFLAYAEAAERLNHLGVARQALVDYGALVTKESDQGSREARIGRLSMRLKEPQIAVVWFRKAVLSRPNDMSVQASLADAQLALARRSK